MLTLILALVYGAEKKEKRLIDKMSLRERDCPKCGKRMNFNLKDKSIQDCSDNCGTWVEN